MMYFKCKTHLLTKRWTKENSLKVMHKPKRNLNDIKCTRSSEV